MVDFSLVWDLRIQGAQQARQELNQVADAFAKGEASANDLDLAIRKYEKAASEATRTQRTMNNEWKIAHPALSQFSRGIDVLSSSAFRLKSIYDTVNLALIRQNTSTTKNAELLNQKAILERQLADIRNSPDYDPTKPTQKELELKQQISALDTEMANNGSDNFTQMADVLLQVGLYAPVAVKAVTDLIAKWGTLKGMVDATGQATGAMTPAAGTGALGLGDVLGTGIIGLSAAFSATEGWIIDQAQKAGLLPKTAQAASDSDRYQILGPNAARDKLSGQIVPLWNTVQDNSKDVAKTSTSVVDTWYTVKTNSGDVAKSSGSVADSWYDVKKTTSETQKSASDSGISLITAGQNIYNALVTAWNTIRTFSGGGSTMTPTPSTGGGTTTTSPPAVTNPADPWTAFLASHPGAIRLGEHAAKLPGGQITAFANGGTLLEPVMGVGQRTGQMYTFAENGPEEFLGSGSAARHSGSPTYISYNTNIVVQGSVITEQKMAEIVSREQSINYKRRYH